MYSLCYSDNMLILCECCIMWVILQASDLTVCIMGMICCLDRWSVSYNTACGTELHHSLCWSPWVSFTKLCNALYNQLTCHRSHRLILLTNCYIALCRIARASPCVTLYYTARLKLRLYTRTGHTSSTYDHLCERPPMCCRIYTQSWDYLHLPVHTL